ncbi:hypothetical protein HYQ40_07020 [Aerococcaceae bacterium DSM 111021]|nr:hypothetical protein [Aerococcaceae bacterium DSM 111021]
MIPLRIKKIVTACLFFAFIFYSAWANIKENHEVILNHVEAFFNQTEDEVDELPNFVNDMSALLNDQVSDRYLYVEGYGYIQKLLLKHEVSNFSSVRDDEGNMHYTYFTTGPNETIELASRMGRLNSVAKDLGAEVIYLMTPDKFEVGVTNFDTGIPYNYANETADQFLSYLDDFQITYIDYRSLMKEQNISIADSFYKTDHHWKTDVTFWAFTQLVNELEERYGFEFNNKEITTDLTNYNQIVYEDAYLGSMGRSVGQLYTGIDDFTLIYPKFETNFHVYEQSSTLDITRQGRFEESLLNTSILRSGKNKYDPTSDKFFTYMDGNPGIVQVTNLQDDSEEMPKVLFIKDSMIVPVASFLSVGTQQTTMVDPRYYGGSIEEIIEDGDYDYIFVTYTPQNLTEEFFPFYRSE